MVFLDTCVFLYAAGAQHPEKPHCERLLERVGRQELEATTNAEVIQEIVYVLARRERRQQAIELSRKVSALFPDMLPVTRADMLSALEILEAVPVPARDAVHAATMKSNGIAVVVSVDPHFDAIPGIVRRTPAEVAGESGPKRASEE